MGIAWLLWIVILALLVWFIFGLAKGNLGAWGSGGSSGGESALDILKKRYARGEITKDEYQKMKKDLEG